jgi:glycosyltransferase involved in cell wall biosynthesis
MKSGKRILIFSSSYLPVIGGLQAVAHNLAKELIANGHEVRVVTNRYPVALPASEQIGGVPVDRLLLLRPAMNRLRLRRPDLFVASLYFGPQSQSRLVTIFQQFRPQVVNVHFPDQQILPILKLRKRFAFRLVVSLHGHDIARFVNGNNLKHGTRADALRNLQALLKSADAVTAVSRDLLNKAIQVEPDIRDKSHVIHNGVDAARFAETEAYQHPRRYILAVGRLIHKKGFDLLIEAYAGWQGRDKPDLIIAGSGEEHEALTRQVELLQLNGKVHFFGAASPDEVVRLMNGCGGVVVPSREETFGIVALEALAAGKSVVATNIGGLGEFLSPLVRRNGDPRLSLSSGFPPVILVEPTVQGIATGLNSAFETRQKTRQIRLPEEFTWPNVARGYERVLLD